MTVYTFAIYLGHTVRFKIKKEEFIMEEITKTSANSQEDLELVEVIVKGRDTEGIERQRCEQAFAQLFGKYKDQLFFRFKVKGSDTESAEDFLMETFEKAFKKIGSYKPEYAFSTWLYSIASHLYIDHKRKTKDEDVVNIESCATDDGEGNTMTFEVADDARIPDAEMEIQERAKAVRKAVENIKNDTIREMVVLRYFEEKSYEEISELTGAPIGTVKGNLNRAKSELASVLAKLK